MKTNNPTVSPKIKRPLLRVFLPAAAIGLSLSSCVVSERGYRGHGRPVTTVTTVGVGAGYYDTLPSTYNDPYYYYNNRYYYGGTWEQGRYPYNGQYYEGRYMHNGQYFYGGRYTVSRTHKKDSHHHDHDRDRDHDRH